MKKILSLILSCFMAGAMNAQTVEDATYGTLDFGVDGFAAYAGEPGTSHYLAGGTTGGAGGEVVVAENFSQLQAYLQSTKPYIILVKNDITTGITAYVDALSTGKLCDKQDGSEGVATTYGERIMVADNKTLIGIANDKGEAPLFSRITFVILRASNVIIRNCRFTMNGAPILKSGENKIVAWREGAQKEVGDPDCIGMQADDGGDDAKKYYGGHIWIDHCEFFNGNAANKDRYDGLIDCKNNIRWLTYSYNLFHDHDKACLLGKGNSDVFEGERTISMHHNYFKDIQGSRLPKQRGSFLHYLNNYMNGCQDGWDLEVKAVSYAEACYFKNSKAPILVTDKSGSNNKINICTDDGYGIVYDNCSRVIKTPSAGITYKNEPAKYDKEFDISSFIDTWVPTDVTSTYKVNNKVKAEQVPDFCEKYSGACKIEIWKEYASEVPAYSQTNLQTALDNLRTLTKKSGSETYYTYDAQGNKMTKAPAPTAVENINGNVNGNANKVQKAIVDGKLVIIKDGKQFNSAGAQVQ